MKNRMMKLLKWRSLKTFLNVDYKVHYFCYLNIQGGIKSSETVPMMNNGKLSSSK